MTDNLSIFTFYSRFLERSIDVIKYGICYVKHKGGEKYVPLCSMEYVFWRDSDLT